MLGLLGGFATPILLSTNENRPIPLFAYLLLLNVGLAWVAYRNGWIILSTLTLVFTTLYQWGWVAEYLDAAQAAARDRHLHDLPADRLRRADGRAIAAEHRASRRMAITSNGPCWRRRCCRCCSRSISRCRPGFNAHYALIFGWLLLIDIGLLAVAIARSTRAAARRRRAGHLLAVALWLTISYLPGAMVPMMGFVAVFVALYLAAPKIAERFGDAFEGIGEHAILVAPLLLIAFPLLVMQEPRAASPVMIFPALFALVALIVWRAFTEDTGRLYFIAAFFALATEAAWSSRFLVPETLPGALATYGAFALLYLGVPHLARRRGTPLRPTAGPAWCCCSDCFS